MTTLTNHLGQPIGFALPGWKPAKVPPRTPMQGRYCRVEPLDEAHGDELYAAFREDRDGRNWTYNPEGPFESRDEFGAWLTKQCGDASRLAHAIIDARDGKPLGIASFMRIDPAGGCIEVGSVNFTPRLQRTRMATEAMYLMMRRVFEELGYRRCEWKCDSLNEPSPVSLTIDDARRSHVLAAFSLRSGALVAAYAALRCSRKALPKRELDGRSVPKCPGMERTVAQCGAALRLHV